MPRRNLTLVVAVVVLALAAGALWWWQQRGAMPPPTAEPRPEVALAPASAPASMPAAPTEAASAEPAPLPPGVTPLPADDAAAVQQALVELLGKPAVLQWVLTDAFPDRVVATVDNLGRGFAAPRLWPVVPTPGRFTVDGENQIAAANAARYDGFVRQVESVDPQAAAMLYRRMLPQLQASYENLGYPNQRFDARLRKVIDEMLAAPTPRRPIQLRLTEVKGPVSSERPWVRYEFADPALEALPAGQKLMLRIGDDNRRRLTAWLQRFRDAISQR
jgi:hypothetical protein